MDERPVLEEITAWKSPLFWLYVVAFVVICVVFAGCNSDPYRAVCELHVQDGLFGTEGSGTLIYANKSLGQGVVLSCRHVNEKEGSGVTLKWLNADAQRTTGIVIHVMEGDGFETDLALILCWLPEGVEPVPVGEFDPAGGPLVSVGWRDGEFYESVAFDAFEEDGLIKTTQPFIGGMSGGPSFQDGKLVGVAVGSNRRDSSVSVDGERLQEIVEFIP